MPAKPLRLSLIVHDILGHSESSYPSWSQTLETPLLLRRIKLAQDSVCVKGSVGVHAAPVTEASMNVVVQRWT